MIHLLYGDDDRCWWWVQEHGAPVERMKETNKLKIKFASSAPVLHVELITSEAHTHQSTMAQPVCLLRLVLELTRTGWPFHGLILHTHTHTAPPVKTVPGIAWAFHHPPARAMLNIKMFFLRMCNGHLGYLLRAVFSLLAKLTHSLSLRGVCCICTKLLP